MEDEPVICELCRRVRPGEGFEVDIGVDGKVAQDMIDEQQYHLYLFDIKLPLMDGKELYQWLQEKRLQEISRVIFTTGAVLGKDTMIFIEHTGRPYLPKPFTPDELKTIVRETLEKIEQ